MKGIKPEEKIRELLKITDSQFRKGAKRLFREVLYRKWGIISFTDDQSNMLMWSYYTSNQGFCIEYNLKQFSFKHHGPFYINYADNIKPINLSQEHISLGVIFQATVKSKQWEHESEWRIIAESNIDMVSPSPALEHLKGVERKFFYSSDAIKSITLGNRFFHSNELKENSDSIMEITLKENKEIKSKLLDIIIERNISCFICLRGEDATNFRLESKKICFEKTNGVQYKMIGY